MRSQTELAFDLLKTYILDLELRPGELVSEKRLIELTGCGRTPVREAMQRLQRDGLLQIVPFRGAFVTDVSSKDVDEISQVRERLEPFAASLAARRMAHGDLERLRAMLDSLEPPDLHSAREFFEVDRAFHTCIVEASGHRRIREIIGTLNDQIQRLRYLSAADPARAAEAHAEHRLIAAALDVRDADGAEEAMRLHLQHAHENLSRIVG
jgi:DNA-binding GntR family transcriptional regulator